MGRSFTVSCRPDQLDRLVRRANPVRNKNLVGKQLSCLVYFQSTSERKIKKAKFLKIKATTR
jgi:hypothetical protein